MPLRETITDLCRDRLGREPDLENPQGFNDLIQWLKLYDQRREHIIACDKWAVRKFVRKRADCLVPARLGAVPKWFPCAIKCTHDSGSIRILESVKGLDRANRDLRELCRRRYGEEKGEWAYRFVPRRVFTEKLLEHSITDYKFHCGHGKVRWAQVIRDRRSENGPRETILAADGGVLSLHMDQNMRHDPDAGVYPGDEAWAGLTRLAERLADGWRYVRVDLYWSRERPWFGELTFWPLAGCYLTPDEPEFGKMLGLDLSEKLEPIVT